MSHSILLVAGNQVIIKLRQEEDTDPCYRTKQGNFNANRPKKLLTFDKSTSTLIPDLLSISL